MFLSPRPSVVVGCHSDLDLKEPIFSCPMTLIVDTSVGLFMSSFDPIFLFSPLTFLHLFQALCWSNIKGEFRAGVCECVWIMGSLGGETAKRKAMWLYPKVLGSNPSERWGQSACCSHGVVYIFGVCKILLEVKAVFCSFFLIISGY